MVPITQCELREDQERAGPCTLPIGSSIYVYPQNSTIQILGGNESVEYKNAYLRGLTGEMVVNTHIPSKYRERSLGIQTLDKTRFSVAKKDDKVEILFLR